MIQTHSKMLAPVKKRRAPDRVIRHFLRRAGPLTTLGTMAEKIEGTRQEVKQNCIQALSQLGATEEFCLFFGDILQTEHDMNSAIYKMQQSLTPEREDEPIDPAVLFKILQDLTRHFNEWKANLEVLDQRGRGIPALDIDPRRIKEHSVLKLLCSLETKDVNVHQGDQVTITDTQPNTLKIVAPGGAEGFVPALCCILPTPDKSAFTATERLRIQLLCSWTECVRKTKRLLSDTLITSCKRLAREWRPPSQNGPTVPKDRVARRVRRILDAATRAPHCDYNKLHSCLYSLERELISYNMNGADITRAVDKICNLDKSVLCFYNYYKQWYTFRRNLEQSSLRPIRVVEHLNALRQIPATPRNYKYLEYKMTVHNIEIKEEILYINEPTEDSLGSRTEKVKADQLTQSEQEEKKKFVINGVVDPRDHDRVISIGDAIAEGIVVQETGLYVNPATRESITIPEAMNQGMIRVELVTSTKSVEKTKAVGLISVRTPDESQNYVITGAMDAATGERVDIPEAKRRGIVNDEMSLYYLVSTDESFPIQEAVMSGWITADFEGGEQRFETKTYAVTAVVDQRLKTKVLFQEAVRRNLIDKETGNYINNATGEKMYVVDAIRKGFLKAKVVDDTDGLNIDTENKMVVEKMDKIRKSVLKSVGVIKAFKEAARRMSSGDQP